MTGLIKYQVKTQGDTQNVTGDEMNNQAAGWESGSGGDDFDWNVDSEDDSTDYSSERTTERYELLGYLQ